MAGVIPTALLEQVRAASDIVEIIGSYFPLKKAGGNFTALCPFHKERTPSFHVNPRRQTFHCFGCHKGGDVFRFVQDYENVGFVESIQRLGRRAGIAVELDHSPGQQRHREIKEILLTLHEQVASRWQSNLANEPAAQLARDYLHKRGVSADSIKEFRLGYSLDRWDDLLLWGRPQGYTAEILGQAGLAIARENGTGHYDRFRGRLMFPINDEQGRVIGFSGRVIDGDDKTAKYINSPETILFHKSRVFYGLDKARRAMLDAGRALICEGQLDLIACHAAGIGHIVAPQGTALTADHIHILKRYVDEILLCFDSDNAGQTAAIRSLDNLLASGMAIRVVRIPAPHDPDSYIREHGAEGFEKLVTAAEGFFDFHLDRLCVTNDARSDRGRQAIVRAMGSALHKAGNAVLMDQYAQKTALALGATAESVRIEFQKIPEAVLFQTEPAANDEPPRNPPSNQEMWLVRLLFAPMPFPKSLAEFDPTCIDHPSVLEIVRSVQLKANGAIPEVAQMTSELTPAAASLLTEALAEERPIPNPQQQFEDVIVRLRNRQLDRELMRLRQQLADPGVSETDTVALLAKQQRLREIKRSPMT
ncbi:MAG: DNA primase [Pedosphaera sp.]|nr:DNA primase [Pedosphaera sp.]